MKEYNLIGTFKYKTKNYQMLLDKDKKYYFLKINENDEYEYPTLNELITFTIKFCNNNDVMLFNIGKKDKQKKKMKLIPKVLIGALAVTLSIGLLSYLQGESSKMDLSNVSYVESVSYAEDSTKEENNDATQRAIDKMLKEVEEEKENFKVETYQEGVNLKLIYDANALDEVLDYKKEDITYDTIKQTINNNNGISSKYKEMYIKLADNLKSDYPDMDLRVWYENMKTMKIEEVDEMTMKVKAISGTASACYRIDENTIYTVKDYDYKPGTWEYQVITHEMCHPIRTAYLQKGKDEIRIKFESYSGNGMIVGEALNSLLSLRSYDKSEQDIAYQLQSNMVEVMVDSLDNYSYQDYVEHNLTYFENELNKQNNDDKAVEAISLIELQYNDYHDSTITVDQSTYYPLYDYISKMYYDKNINSNMSIDEIQNVKNDLVNKIIYDVPEDYNIDQNHFNDYLNTYCNEKGLSSGKQL